MSGTDFKLSLLEKNKRKIGFFLRDAKRIAKDILGDYLVLRLRRQALIGKIVETEAYLGVNDDAAHSFGGKVTPRNKVTYAEGGVIYTYLIYGKFWCFNLVVSKKGDPQTVFIRALEPVAGIERMKKNRRGAKVKNLANGPCRWTQSFKIKGSFSGKSIVSGEIFIVKGKRKKFSIISAKRVGISYATRSKNLPLRFYIKGSPFISKS